jgi:hypothetical protein
MVMKNKFLQINPLTKFAKHHIFYKREFTIKANWMQQNNVNSYGLAWQLENTQQKKH